MGDDHQQEWNLLLPLLPALLIVPILAVLGVEPLDLGFAAILAPLLMFPIVLLVGRFGMEMRYGLGNSRRVESSPLLR